MCVCVSTPSTNLGIRFQHTIVRLAAHVFLSLLTSAPLTPPWSSPPLSPPPSSLTILLLPLLPPSTAPLFQAALNGPTEGAAAPSASLAVTPASAVERSLPKAPFYGFAARFLQ